MKKYVVKFSQTFRNEKKEILAVVASEVDMPMKEDVTTFAAYNAAPNFVKGILPANAEFEVINVSSTKPRKEKEVAPVATTTTNKA